jgi:DNA-binding SARP family transcriptional activator
VAFTLWLEKREERALANLRSMLWRLHDELDGIIATDSSEIALDPEITVDYLVARRAALDVLEGRSGTLPSIYIGELLPGWYEDWVVTERERLRVLHLHALERQAEACLEEGDSGAAINAAMAATAMDPLRESAQQLMIRASLAQGNTADAIRIYDSYRSSLQQQLGLDPSPMLTELVWSGERLAL